MQYDEIYNLGADFLFKKEMKSKEKNKENWEQMGMLAEDNRMKDLLRKEKEQLIIEKKQAKIKRTLKK